MTAKCCMVVAGEASGDTLAAELVTAIQALVARQSPFGWRFIGAGGAAMKKAGVEILVDLTAHAVVGVWEVLKHYPELRRLFAQLVASACQHEPDVIVLADYPGFNLRFAAAIKRYVRARRGPYYNWNPRIVYYVSPQIWAWHASRVQQIARDVDLVISIFPFEQSWYAERAPQLPVEYVGHPLIERFASTLPTAPVIQSGQNSAHAQHSEPKPCEGKPSAASVVLLPGSRQRELRKHAAILAEVARRISQQTTARCLMILPSHEIAAAVRALIGSAPELTIQAGGLAEALTGADLALAASGTVTLECAYFGVPTIVIYRTSWSTYWLGKRCIKVKYLAMPNLLVNEEVYPELIQDAATPDRITNEALDLLQNPERRSAIRLRLSQVIGSLGSPGASMRAAALVVRAAG